MYSNISHLYLNKHSIYKYIYIYIYIYIIFNYTYIYYEENKKTQVVS